MVSGGAQVQGSGAARYAVRVDVDPRQLAARGIGLDEVAQSISDANANVPTGNVLGSDRSFVVLANGSLLKAAAYGPPFVAYRHRNPAGLADAAHLSRR